jgi:hypothetical protein
MRQHNPLKLQEALNAYQLCGSFRKASKKLGIPRSTLQERYKEALKQNLKYDSELDIEDLHATSTLYDGDGKLLLQWVKKKAEEQNQKILFQEGVKAFAEKLPRVKPINKPKNKLDKDLMTCFPVGDHHLGLLVWGEENRTEDYDLKIGEDLLISAFEYLLELSCSEYATLVFLGDFLHYDSFESVTPTSRNALDSDTRYPLMVRTAIRCIRRMIESAAATHEKVHVIIEIGNHDLSSSIFLMECLANIYEKDPRITIDTHPGHYHYFDFGNNLVGVHHGHGAKAKLKDLPLIMATDVPELWGNTKYRYIWTGHVHHDAVFDQQGCKVESFRVLPPGDAWAYNEGYRSMSDMKSITLHAKYGEIARHTVNPPLLAEK